MHAIFLSHFLSSSQLISTMIDGVITEVAMLVASHHFAILYLD
jgi:hypothetical protein